MASRVSTPIDVSPQLTERGTEAGTDQHGHDGQRVREAASDHDRDEAVRRPGLEGLDRRTGCAGPGDLEGDGERDRRQEDRPAQPQDHADRDTHAERADEPRKGALGVP